MQLTVALININVRWYPLREKDLEVYTRLRNRLYYVGDSMASKRPEVQLRYLEKAYAFRY